MTEQRRRRRWKFSRDTILFLAGLAGIAYEALGNHGDRPTLLILYAGMVGLPAFLRGDERLQERPKDTTDDSRLDAGADQ